MSRLYLGFDAEERAQSPYARFFNPVMAPLPGHVLEALSKGPVAHELIMPFARAAELQDDGYAPVETGYTLAPDGSARIACLTHMPRVTPAMWHWWFAWHGSEAQRYKLWHPLAHVDVAWADGRGDTGTYLGRTSNIVEYVGAPRLNVGVRFVPPAEAGFDSRRLEEQGAVAIVGRCLMRDLNLEAGWLIHLIRPVPGGSEMRSRFWLGGPHINPIGMTGAFGKALGGVAAKLRPFTAAQAAELMIHDAQEMNHLAAFLPELHAAFGAAP
ncbi:MAG: hypothetical protein JSR60_06210 [Proteobacteria bacterium]|nr:hypothetical protein [Pseudomonadota bacterium]